MFKHSIRSFTEQKLISMLHSTGEEEEHIDFYEAHVLRRGHAILYVIAGSNKEMFFDPRQNLREFILEEFDKREENKSKPHVYESSMSV